ncbi:hypothetical protein TRIATDRAFT_85458 [Trichoderma atroviride IMI 206040]|uniref:Uncharacterized protein n=1 Tax=Hypocrea atroviridis (strain ATCC 20476 / IMI 206040) TaxID=452589 RepID=G9P6W0_HYPAI|nr:uncharacterized protein TRIATDRAFT_85458 [Trichoderma atroviride IMI 206040]EHK40685.1 hypothetical protein TRIATDRAFT_85458 [Trichoderma atroviride IMI 206040]
MHGDQTPVEGGQIYRKRPRHTKYYMAPRFLTDREALSLVRYRHPLASSTNDSQATAGRMRWRQHREAMDPGTRVSIRGIRHFSNGSTQAKTEPLNYPGQSLLQYPVTALRGPILGTANLASPLPQKPSQVSASAVMVAGLARVPPAATAGFRNDQASPALQLQYTPIACRIPHRGVCSISLGTALLRVGGTCFEYNAPTASVLDSVDTGCQASTACIQRPTAVAYTLRTIFLLYTCIDVEERRRGQKALWLCACMQARDVVLSGTAGARCRRKLSGTEHAYRVHPVDTRGAMCLR